MKFLDFKFYKENYLAILALIIGVIFIKIFNLVEIQENSFLENIQLVALFAGFIACIKTKKYKTFFTFLALVMLLMFAREISYGRVFIDENVVHFNKGFVISDDFSLLIRGYGFEVGANILQLSGNDEFIIVEYKYDKYNDIYYFELIALYKNNRYMIILENPYHSQEISLRIRRKNTLFEMEVGI